MVSLRVPMEVIEQKCALYLHRGKPAQRAQLFMIATTDCQQVPGGVSRRCSVLSPGPECRPVRESKMGSRNVAPQNPGRQTWSVAGMARKYKATTRQTLAHGNVYGSRFNETKARNLWSHNLEAFPSNGSTTDHHRSYPSVSHDKSKRTLTKSVCRYV